MARPHAGRRAIVTGGAQGIGRAIALELAADGAEVAIVDRVDAGATVDEIRAAGGQARSVLCDIAVEAEVAALKERLMRDVGAVHILVNNAGVFPVIPWDALKFEDWRSVMSVNLDGAFLMCRAFGPVMETARFGRIINLASSAVATGVLDFAPYIASKMGVIGLTRALASEYGPRGITVNAIAPGLVRTPSTMDRARAPGGISSAEEFAALIAAQAIKRSAEPSDIAGLASFLASDKAGFITGQTMFADGGVVRV